MIYPKQNLPNISSLKSSSFSKQIRILLISVASCGCLSSIEPIVEWSRCLAFLFNTILDLQESTELVVLVFFLLGLFVWINNNSLWLLKLRIFANLAVNLLGCCCCIFIVLFIIAITAERVKVGILGQGHYWLSLFNLFIVVFLCLYFTIWIWTAIFFC